MRARLTLRVTTNKVPFALSALPLGPPCTFATTATASFLRWSIGTERAKEANFPDALGCDASCAWPGADPAPRQRAARDADLRQDADGQDDHSGG